jgi:hypothetical protein
MTTTTDQARRAFLRSPDEVLAAAARAGDGGAFGELEARYWLGVQRYVGEHTRYARPEVLVEEVFSEAGDRLGGFRGDEPGAFGLWLFGTVAHSVIEHRGGSPALWQATLAVPAPDMTAAEVAAWKEAARVRQVAAFAAALGGAAPEGVTVDDLVRASGLSRSWVHRALDVLAEAGALPRDGARRSGCRFVPVPGADLPGTLAAALGRAVGPDRVIPAAEPAGQEES